MNRISVSSPSNIAFIKYWGMSDARQTLPNNPSISMTLSQCLSFCTLSPRTKGAADEIMWKTASGLLVVAQTSLRLGIERHLQPLREYFDDWTPLRIATTNNFPTGAGIASSASGFSALAVAFALRCGQSLDSPDLGRLARLSGSGSAARSVLGGFVQWPGDSRQLCEPVQLAAGQHWPLHDLIAIVDATPKTVSSRQGHLLANSSPFYPTRLDLLPERLATVRQAIVSRDFNALAAVVEREAVELHMIAMTSQPPIFYWKPATLRILERVRQLRGEGLEVCATVDAGPNVHVICTEQHKSAAFAALRTVPGIERWIFDQAGDGPRRLARHLF
ncbi:diphosphomevalonate decarboxylase [Pseudomonas sp. B21-040]|jgi:diphosphomevalonate decarboxylase|uniref:diphosphomevalonate decarboxylase n=1 Tax=Pseudomonas TaxID=286 RepID=UPI00069BB838|nr:MULTISPECIES: diphosphomevalonate decarboxylase [Pseudomonas]OOG13779.1 diphosphomevalonate decarboxylase [Pseudomonas sp. C9]PWK44495.1 diphosphomevalonate decarboxylase [Pseudomonas sp. OV226]UVL39401.1 diphosphomevalonate decarboxylase [Pseudomonas sp. B21-040]